MSNTSSSPDVLPDAEDALDWRRSVLLASLLGAMLAGIAVVLVVVLDDAKGGDGVARLLPFALLVLAVLAWRLYRADIESLRRDRDGLADEVARLHADSARLRDALAQAQEELARSERVDQLTGLSNERAFAEAVAEEWRRAARLEKPLALLLIEIDHFSAVARQADDELVKGCLSAVGTVLKNSARRAGDLAARCEKERFSLLFSNCNAGTATTLARRIHAAVAALHHPLPAHPPGGRLSVSIGVAATSPAMTDKPDRLIADAEDALHAATAAGGNRVDTNWQAARSA